MYALTICNLFSVRHRCPLTILAFLRSRCGFARLSLSQNGAHGATKRTTPLFEDRRTMDQVQKIITAILAGLVVILIVMYLQRSDFAARKLASKLYKPTYLILGANGAGKTTLFFHLQGDSEKPIPTISSLEPNVGSISIPFSNSKIQKEYQLIDYPGHLKYSQLLRKLIVEDVTLSQLKGIVYVIDSADQFLSQEENVLSIAKQLYALLSITEKIPNGVDYMFAVNKQDLFDSRPVLKVKKIIEEKLGKLIKEDLTSKGSTRGGSGIDNDDDEDDEQEFKKQESTRDFWKAVVGHGREFKFEVLEGNMDFIGGSVTKGKLSNWENWFDEKAVNYGGM